MVGWLCAIAPASGDGSTKPLPQTTSIDGRVVDQSGQPVPGASVTAMLQTGGARVSTTTDSDGRYQFPNLPDGVYRVDFDVTGFDLVRRNHVHVSAAAAGHANATLNIATLCDCVQVAGSVPLSMLRERAGQVVDQSGHLLAHARLELGIPAFVPGESQWSYADRDGRFVVRLPMNASWPLKASDSGFAVATVNVSAKDDVPLALKLVGADTVALPDTERFRRSCCPSYFFTHAGR